MMRLPVSHSRLMRRGAIARDGRVRRVTWFPMFDDDGITHALLAVNTDDGTVRRLRYEPGCIEVPLFGPIRVPGDLPSVPVLTEEDAAAMVRLWHFDPVWVMRRAVFDGQPIVPWIAATNCVQHFTKPEQPVQRVWFARDLSRLTRVVRGEGSGEVFSRDLLTPRQNLPELVVLPQRARRRPASSCGWRLSPVWQR